MLIVVIAGVIFIPDLLDGKKELVKEEFKKIPPKPVVDQSPIVSEFPKQKITSEIKAVTNISNETASDDESTEIVTKNSPEQASESAIESSIEQKNSQPSVEVEQPVLDSETPLLATVPAFEKSAWVLRLGTFRNKPNVDALLSKLQEAGVTTFVKPVEAKAGTLYRVFVGPELDKVSLESAQKTLKTLTGLDGKITQFEPVN